MGCRVTNGQAPRGLVWRAQREETGVSSTERDLPEEASSDPSTGQPHLQRQSRGLSSPAGESQRLQVVQALRFTDALVHLSGERHRPLWALTPYYSIMGFDSGHM